MFLIVGLGNPGKKYEKTRHNVGFMVLDEFQKEHGFPDFSPSKKHSSLVSEGILNSIKIVLAKPQTFMNNSGSAVKLLLKQCLKDVACRYDRSDKEHLLKNFLIIHDDIDIPLGKVKISKGSGSAGHKGAESIIQSLGTKDFTRIRIGIQPEKGKPNNVEDFVLQPFRKSELSFLQSAIQEAIASVSSFID